VYIVEIIILGALKVIAFPFNSTFPDELGVDFSF